MAPFLRRPPPRPASFHGTTATITSDERNIRRAKTQTDLLDARRKLSPPPNPPKILVKVTVQRSLGPIPVMASTNWTVNDLKSAVIKIYIKEERIPLLYSSNPSAFGLHYSQFCLESLDPEEKLNKLGWRNFFLCPKREDRPVAVVASSPARCWKEVEKGCRIGIPWLRFMDCLM